MNHAEHWDTLTLSDVSDDGEDNPRPHPVECSRPESNTMTTTLGRARGEPKGFRVMGTIQILPIKARFRRPNHHYRCSQSPWQFAWCGVRTLAFFLWAVRGGSEDGDDKDLLQLWHSLGRLFQIKSHVCANSFGGAVSTVVNRRPDSLDQSSPSLVLYVFFFVKSIGPAALFAFFIGTNHMSILN